MLGFVPERPQMWALGLASGLLIFFFFLAFLAITRHNETVYPRDNAGLQRLHEDQCERPVDKGWIVEVQNTISNAGYALAGALILFRAQSWAAHMFAANLIVLAIASGLYHATLSDLTRILDVGWVYAVLLSLSTFAAYAHVQADNPVRVPIWSVWVPSGLLWVGLLLAGLGFTGGVVAVICLTLFIVGISVLCYLVARVLSDLKWFVVPAAFIGIPLFGVLIRAEFGWDSTMVFIAMVGLLIIQLAFIFGSAKQVYAHKDMVLMWSRLWWEMLIIALVLLPGFFFRLRDGYDGEGANAKERILCLPDSAFQAHAHWHVLGAVGLLLAYDLLVQFQRSNGSVVDDRTVILPDREVIELDEDKHKH